LLNSFAPDLLLSITCQTLSSASEMIYSPALFAHEWSGLFREKKSILLAFSIGFFGGSVNKVDNHEWSGLFREKKSILLAFSTGFFGGSVNKVDKNASCIFVLNHKMLLAGKLYRGSG
jgi:hypothetical protein